MSGKSGLLLEMTMPAAFRFSGGRSSAEREDDAFDVPAEQGGDAGEAPVNGTLVKPAPVTN